MTFILALLARPAILASVIGSLVAGSLGVWLYLEKGRHASDVANLTLQIKDEQLKVKNEQNARLIVEKNRVELQGKFDEISAKVDRMALEAKQAEAAANVAAIRAFNLGRAEAEKLRSPTSTVPSGAPGMNTWLNERLVTP